MTPQRILPDLQCSIICDGFRQEANGNLILLGVMDRILSTQFPIKVPQILVVNRWTAGKGKFNQSVRLFATDQTTQLAKVDGQVQLPDPVVSATTILGMGNFTIEKPGPYWIEVIIDDVLKLRYALPVFQVNQQPPGAQPKAGDAPAADA
jgi:hypothetical protein